MLRFLIDLVVSAAILNLAIIPIIKVSQQRRRVDSPRRWRIGALVCALVIATLGWSSRDLVSKCEAARNPACIDPGSIGFQLLIGGGFACWALLAAYLLYND